MKVELHFWFKITIAGIFIVLLVGCSASREWRQVEQLIEHLSELPPAVISGGEVAGVRFGMSLAEVGKKCRDANRTWVQIGRTGRCSGPVKGTLAKWHREFFVLTCRDQVCMMGFSLDPNNGKPVLIGLDLVVRLNERWPLVEKSAPPDACYGRLIECIELGEYDAQFTYLVESHVLQTVVIVRKKGQAETIVAYVDTNVVGVEAENDKKIVEKEFETLFPAPNQCPGH